MGSKKLVYGIGINDLDYVVQIDEIVVDADGNKKRKLAWICPDYTDWKNMLKRAYSEKHRAKRQTYTDVTVCVEWHRASVFKEWKHKQQYEGHVLDKDIIVPGNKLYSPESCAYVWPLTNTFIVDCAASRGEYVVGVCWNKEKRKYQANCSNPFTKKLEYLGRFTNEPEAHEAWRKRKHELAQLVADTESDIRVVEALKKRYSFDVWYKNNPIKTA